MPRKDTQMKKKSLFLLASGVAAAALIGGTFASWAVTDNADPFSIKVSTGSVTSDDTEYITLSWGSSQSMGNVSNLALGTYRKAGVLDLRADTVAGESDFRGTLSVAVQGQALLKSKLHVDIYRGELAATDGVIAASTLSGKTAVDLSGYVSVNKNEANLFTVVVYLDNGTTAQEIEQMANQQVTVTFDWGEGDDVITDQTFYATGFSATPYIYAWTGSAVNHAWPGIAMEAVAGRSGYYTAKILATYENVIFTTADESQKSGDISIATAFAGGKNLFTYDGNVQDVHGTFGTYQDLQTPDYYLVGDEWGGWDATAAGAVHLTLSGGTATVDITNTHNDAQFKILDVANNIWYAENSTDGAAGNFTLGEIHTYTITFNPNPTGDNPYISCVVKA